MSTRGVIARQKGDAFEGRYHHWDSYPTGLGKALWELAHSEFKCDLEGMLHFLIDEHPAGWSTICNKDFSLKPRFNEHGKGNCLKCGKPSWEHYYQEWESHGKRLTEKAKESMSHGNYMALGHSSGQPRTTNAECYCHGDRQEDGLLVTMKNAAEMGCEYAYVFSNNAVDDHSIFHQQRWQQDGRDVRDGQCRGQMGSTGSTPAGWTGAGLESHPGLLSQVGTP
ncbi:MAG: hypothetical protein HYX80_09680 [Chloroflexi bacterium]|nr:hypothetical protein [Chloroflexota bacterium]